ncbi:MAG: hypothetical protein NZ533_01655 [Casimicrobiaceae bacterium]|nr:hypothetical protein [Casimicrobiaceae bacterium]MCX8097423.1 hypothetical protein [Casimicrobiaceae bacterium]MDW8312057.1 hypothetical protein [Burkholderiales bacterium]
MRRSLLWIALAAALVPQWALAAPDVQPAASKDNRLTVVYWSARDCRWCTWWEGRILGSGGEAAFLASPEGKAVRYITVKKNFLAIPYAEHDFKPDQKWLWKLLESGKHRRIVGFPSFSLLDGEELVVYAVGQDGFRDELLPKLRERLAKR